MEAAGCSERLEMKYTEIRSRSLLYTMNLKYKWEAPHLFICEWEAYATLDYTKPDKLFAGMALFLGHLLLSAF
jgi:hypothetical protein